MNIMSDETFDECFYSNKCLQGKKPKINTIVRNRTYVEVHALAVSNLKIRNFKSRVYYDTLWAVRKVACATPTRVVRDLKVCSDFQIFCSFYTKRSSSR